jgi:hypothetical protein
VGPPEPAGATAPAPIVIAVVRCAGCGREYFSAAVPRVAAPLAPCGDCGAEQHVADLIVRE